MHRLDAERRAKRIDVRGNAGRMGETERDGLHSHRGETRLSSNRTNTDVGEKRTKRGHVKGTKSGVGEKPEVRGKRKKKGKRIEGKGREEKRREGKRREETG